MIAYLLGGLLAVVLLFGGACIVSDLACRYLVLRCIGATRPRV